MVGDSAHHVGERVGSGAIAVQHLERLAVVRTHTDLEAHGPRVRVVDHAAHLQPVDLTEQHAVLDPRHRAGAGDVGSERSVGGGHLTGRRQRLGDGREQHPALGVPHRHRQRETGGAAGQRAGARLGHDVQLRRALTKRPRQCSTETPRGPVGEQHPRLVAVAQGCPAGVVAGHQHRLAAHVLAHQDGQLQRVELREAGRVVHHRNVTAGGAYPVK